MRLPGLSNLVSLFRKHREEPRNALYLEVRDLGHSQYQGWASSEVWGPCPYTWWASMGPGLHRPGLCVSGWEGIRSSERACGCRVAPLPSDGLLSFPPPHQALNHPKRLQTSSTIGRCSYKTNTGKLQYTEGLVTDPLFSSRITFLEKNFAWSSAFLLVKSEVTWTNI